jgi:hypothetical protein
VIEDRGVFDRFLRVDLTLTFLYSAPCFSLSFLDGGGFLHANILSPTCTKGTGSKTHNEKWAYVDNESPELMALCLKQGLEHTLSKDKLKLIDTR